MTARPLPFTFGNHMHWVDMQWLWGYQVLPDSIDDMLALCKAVGAKGNVNFDGVGYEKLAAEDPAALQRLRDAVQAGTIEVVGASYGQPYGLFVGGESNVRQRVFGARTVRRLLGVWPKTFWEEEFDCFPQLPQMLAGCGFTGASLFFQWTWHTPTVPEEDVPLVLWEGCDGTRLPTVAKTALCLHQWPEDFDGKLELALETERPALVQWLELMPSPDWMCRSEVLLPRLKELFADERFDVEPCTLGELIAKLGGGAAPPVRRYTMDDVFHGMTLGKNADEVPRASDAAEAKILAAEALSSTLGLLGRPYASWDVYPSWELDEAWRELLQAQHHDNHECEGLCGSVGKASFERAQYLATDVLYRGLRHLARHVAAPPEDSLLVFNPLGWERDILVPQSAAQDDWGDEGPGRLARSVPAYGWRVIARGDPDSVLSSRVSVDETAARYRLTAGDLSVEVDRVTGRICEVRGASGTVPVSIGGLAGRAEGAALELGAPDVALGLHCGEDKIRITWQREGLRIVQHVRLRPEHDAISLETIVDELPRPDGGFGGALRLSIELETASPVGYTTDSPYAVHPIRADAQGRDRRKYPTGDWMTSEQWFEDVDRSFTARSFVDLETEDFGLLCIHDGSQGWFSRDGGAEVVVTAYDPWDEGHWEEYAWSEVLLVPHAPGITDGERVRRAAGARALVLHERVRAGTRERAGFPVTFGSLAAARSDGITIEAFFRESRKSFDALQRPFGPTTRNPFVLRLVGHGSEPTDVVVQVPGACASAAKTDLRGAVLEELTVGNATPPAWSPPDLPWSSIHLTLRPREIATVMLDLELGRHQPRHLDQHRHIWATVHRTEKD